jgi:two-component system LytT family sensor kinase
MYQEVLMPKQGSLFSLTSQQTRILYHVLFWITLYILDVLIFGFGYEDVGRFVTLALAEVPPQVLLAYAVMYWTIPRFVARKQIFESVASVIFIFLICGWIGHLLFLAFSLYGNDVSAWSLPKICVRGFYAFLHASIAIAIKLIKLWYENEKRVSEMEKTKLESELKMLKDQINPHFMFNTLNNLYGLIGKNPIHAQESVLGLSRILHYMLHESNHDRIRLSQEIHCIRDYIDLEKLRYPGNLSISLNVQDKIENLSIVPLTIFPFVENSFKHGASEMIKDAWINIDFSTFKNHFVFKIENGKGPKINLAQPNGIGLSNVTRRLELIYQKDHTLQIIDSPDSFLVILKIALVRMKKIESRTYEAEMSYSRG